MINISQTRTVAARQRFSLRYSMGTQIGVVMFGCILLAVVLIASFAAWQQEQSGKELMLTQARSVGLLVAAGSSDGVTFSKRDLLARAAFGVEQQRDFEWIIIRNNQGDTLYTRNFDKAPETIRQGGTLMPLDSVRTMVRENGNVIVAVPVRMLVANDRIGEIVLELQPVEIRAGIDRYRTISILSGLVVALISGVLAFVLAQWLVRPLRNLYEVSGRVADGDLHQRVPEVQGIAALSEPGVLTAGFNAMMQRLDEANNQLLITNKELALVNTHLQMSNAQLEMRTFELSAANDRINEQNQRLQELSKEKDEFLGIAAHDLKNPLTGIQGLAEILMMQDDMPSDRIQSLASTIFKSSQKMFELIKNLLDVNALERGGQHFSPVVFDIAPSLAFAVDVYNERGAEKNISVHFTYPTASSLIYADQMASEQIIDNLISNAVKYSPHGKNVWVTVEERVSYIGAPEGKKEIVVAVRDEGPGLTDEDKSKLFGKFARLSAQPTGGEHSTGLGLSIVKKMLEAMNGRVWCESEFGNGATFLVAFPAGTSKS